MRCTAAAAESRLAIVASRTDCDRNPFLTRLDWRAKIGIGLDQHRSIAHKVRLFNRGVELDELRALLHVVAAVEEILLDDASDLRRHVDALDGDQRADRLHPVDPALASLPAWR